MRSKLIVVCLFLTCALVAQEEGKDPWYKRLGTWVAGTPWRMDQPMPVTHHKLLLQRGQWGVVDEYLSPISHFGWHTSATLLTDYAPPRKGSWHLYQEVMLSLAYPKNKANGTTMEIMRGEFSVGPSWRVLNHKGMTLDVAPLLNIQVQGNWKTSNANNYGNAKGSVGLDGWTRFRYQIPWKVSRIALSYSAQISLLHGTFHPDYGQSYYEYISGGKRIPFQFHFTSWHNNITLKQRLLVDLPIHHLTMTLGAEYYHQNQKLSDTRFTQGYWGVVLGISFDSFLLSGGRSNPSDAISSSLY